MALAVDSAPPVPSSTRSTASRGLRRHRQDLFKIQRGRNLMSVPTSYGLGRSQSVINDLLALMAHGSV
jgi:hypothetical protein